jgi:hypothetical protein
MQASLGPTWLRPYEIPSLAPKYKTVEGTISDKRSKLFRYRVDYGRRKFYSTRANVIKLITAIIYEFL